MRLYFAYGSNLHPARLGDRVVNFRFAGAGRLPGWRLSFAKRGRDGSGKATIAPSEEAGDRVLGALYEIDEAGRAALHRIEGVGSGYLERRVEVEAEDGRREAWTYVAMPEYLDEELAPFDWYRELVVAGARFHGFEEAYVAAIAGIAAAADPELGRTAESRRLLERLAAYGRKGGEKPA